ncbi:hypothetical protein BDM02DRAFT_367301 [Thelephora ganbajun]|uniref:Uncharacterized protein n=1 Tax=Thelephora ganbajun TaxID=370292 RepID=A0ACB6Z8H0_THEGA|nr:hypothetical protein BDM02DRAFT_367301 [Thelephora ganbajun]
MSQFTTTFQGELSAFRKSEENRIARLEKAITGLKSPSIGVDPTTNFWTVYKKVADEYDNDLVSQYTGDLDTSLLFAGLFSAVTTTIIAQLIPQIQPNPVDLTNVLLLRILQQNTSFGGTDPLAPASSIPTSVITAQSILFASLSVTLFVAFIAMLGKQWILYYTRASTWGNIVDRGKERQAKLVGLQKWGFHAIMESLPVLLQIALLLFGAALVVYLWGLDVSAADAVLVTVSIGCVFYACIAVAATVWGDFPFQTPLSVLLSKVLPWAREFTALARVWLRHWARRRVAALLLRVERGKGHAYIARFLGRLCKIFIEDSETPDRAAEDTSGKHYPMTLSNPAFWRNDPLFVPLIPKDFSSASAGLWLLKNSTDFSAASAVAAVFSEFQWPSHYHSTTALIRLRDTYMQCLRESRFDELARLKALQALKL